MNQLITFPTPETTREIQDIMGACPFDYTPADMWYVTLFIATESLDITIRNPEAMYEATPLSAELWYDEMTHQTNLVIAFESNSMMLRHSQIKSAYKSAYTHDNYVPHITLVNGFPPLSPANKTFIRSITLSLRSTPQKFAFVGEELVDSEGYVPNDEGMKHFAERFV